MKSFFKSKTEVDETYSMIIDALLAAMSPDDTRTKDQRILDYIQRHKAPKNVFDKDVYSISSTHAFKHQTTHQMMHMATVSGAPFMYFLQAYKLKK